MGPQTPKAPIAGVTNEATLIVEKISEGKIQNLLSLIPEGQSPRLFIKLVKDQVMGFDKYGKSRRDEDLLLFLYTCKRTGLDPLTRQVYAVFRYSSQFNRELMTIQTGIDGMRLVAQRSGDYAGQDDIIYNPVDEHTIYPVKASCTIWKMVKGARVAFTASARWSEYVQSDKFGKALNLWLKMPYLMLGKCAEALALRKAFPNELSGIYSSEEMSQANNPVVTTPQNTYTYPKKAVPVTVIHGAVKDLTPDKKPEPQEPPKTPPVTTGPSKPIENKPIGLSDAAKQKPVIEPKPEPMTAARIMSSDMPAKDKAEALWKLKLKTGADIKKTPPVETPKK